MTLNDIIVSALAQLDRGHDSQTIDDWRDKLTRYANEAVIDLATLLKLRRTDTLAVANGEINVLLLPKTCVKVLSVTQNGMELAFTQGSTNTNIAVSTTGNVSVHYRYLPDDMSSPTDVPQTPEYTHGLIVSYVVARERASQDPSMQRGANVYFELYNAGKRTLKSNLGEATHKIINRW